EVLEDRAGDHAPEARVRNPGPAPIHSVPAPASALRIAAAASAPWPSATAIESSAGRVTSPAAHTRGCEVAKLEFTARYPSASWASAGRHHSVVGITPALITR